MAEKLWDAFISYAHADAAEAAALRALIEADGATPAAEPKAAEPAEKASEAAAKTSDADAELDADAKSASAPPAKGAAKTTSAPSDKADESPAVKAAEAAPLAAEAKSGESKSDGGEAADDGQAGPKPADPEGKPKEAAPGSAGAETTSQSPNRTVWLDSRTALHAGARPAAAQEALRAAKAVIILWSARSLEDAWLIEEAGYAALRGRAVHLRVGELDESRLPIRSRTAKLMSLEEAQANPARLMQQLNALAARTEPLVDLDRTPRPQTPLVGRAQECSELAAAWTNETRRVLAIVAESGVGKTALAFDLAEQLATDAASGVKAIFSYAFAGQGADSAPMGASDLFFAEALRFFGVDPSSVTGAHAQAIQLASLLASTRTLLILDGVETLQRRDGALHDDAMRSFLQEAARSCGGLCLLTTRLSITGFTAHEELRLADLQPADAVKLLAFFDCGAPPERADGLCEEYASAPAPALRRAKAVVLLGAFVRAACAHDAKPLSAKALKSALDLPDGGSRPAIEAMVRRFERWLEAKAGSAPLASTPEGRQLQILRLLGLFNAPTSWAALSHLLDGPEIQGVVVGGGAAPSTEAWRDALGALRRMGLIDPDGAVGAALDESAVVGAHPAIQIYFNRRLTERAPDGLRAAHRRLYAFFRNVDLPAIFHDQLGYELLSVRAGFAQQFDQIWVALTESDLSDEGRALLPKTLVEASPEALFALAERATEEDWRAGLQGFQPADAAGLSRLLLAVAHGCAGGLGEAAFDEVYRPRLARGGEAYLVRTRGLPGLELSALSHFFADPFTTPVDEFPLERKAQLLKLAAFRLRSIGRMADMVGPVRSAVAAFVELGDPAQAAREGVELAELLISLGQLTGGKGASGAVYAAARAVEQADLSDDPSLRQLAYAVQGDVLLQSGAFARASEMFRLSEAAQKAAQSSRPLLYGEVGARWCDLKLAQGRRAEAQMRATYGLEIAEESGRRFEMALDALTLGRAAHLAAHEGALTYGEALGALNEAVDAMRLAGEAGPMVRAHLARGICRREAGDLAGAEQDLDAANTIARTSGLRLHYADISLEAAWHALVSDDLAQAEEAITFSHAEIAATGYGRRMPELAVLRSALLLLKGDRQAARPHLDGLAAAMRKDDLWSYMAEFEWLVAEFGVDELEPTRDELRAARAKFDAREDAAFAAARRRADGLDDDVVDAHLRNPAFRARLTRAAEIYRWAAPDSLGLAERRELARRYIVEIESKIEQPAQPEAPTPQLAPGQIDQLLARTDVRAQLTRLYSAHGVDTPFEQIARSDHAEVLARLVADGEIKAEPAPAPRTEPAAATPASPGRVATSERREPSAPAPKAASPDARIEPAASAKLAQEGVAARTPAQPGRVEPAAPMPKKLDAAAAAAPVIKPGEERREPKLIAGAPISPAAKAEKSEAAAGGDAQEPPKKALSTMGKLLSRFGGRGKRRSDAV
ncbi:MAG: hypothetical protein MRY74_12790 [Neomegalonema sp.]|nr:hypothetical protein [Neomegalonema sp.]